jgi:hypothetical protein
VFLVAVMPLRPVVYKSIIKVDKLSDLAGKIPSAKTLSLACQPEGERTILGFQKAEGAAGSINKNSKPDLNKLLYTRCRQVVSVIKRGYSILLYVIVLFTPEADVVCVINLSPSKANACE